MRHRLYYHLVWTTRDRAPLIDSTTAEFLCRFLRPMAWKERARILEIGMARTHVHVLLTANPMTNWPHLVQLLKGVSATVANKEGYAAREQPLLWASGYSLQTIGETQVERVRAYLRSQPRHHPEQVIEGWAGDTALSEQLR